MQHISRQLVGLEKLVSFCKRKANVPKVLQFGGDILEVGVLCLEPHSPEAARWSILQYLLWVVKQIVKFWCHYCSWILCHVQLQELLNFYFKVPRDSFRQRPGEMPGTPSSGGFLQVQNLRTTVEADERGATFGWPFLAGLPCR